jgi:two-component system, LuxR family, response regulator FixJ
MSEFSSVIVIADDLELRIALVEMMQRAGFQTRAYGNADGFLVGGVRSPSCFLLDLAMPGINSRDFQAYLRSTWPDAPVIFLSQHTTVAMVVQAVKNGAYDVIELPYRPEELVDKVKAAMEQYSSQSARRVEQQALQERIGKLTAREREILDLVIEGMSTKEMARRLNISPRTVEVHRSRIMRKMDMKTLRDTLRIVLVLRNADNSASATTSTQTSPTAAATAR